VSPEALGYSFRDPALLEQALTHRSYTNEATASQDAGPCPDNERLEFLGDAVLELCVSRLLYDRHPGLPEGNLTQLRARVVSTRPLARVARGLGLGSMIRLGVGEDRSGGRNRSSVLADTLEALVAAIYLDAGLDTAMGFIARVLGPSLELADPARAKDPKSLLQEWSQDQDGSVPRYQVTRVRGPDHAAEFEAEVWVGSRSLGRGQGASKKEAERAAASLALAALG
jgi:ribonuclease-3